MALLEVDHAAHEACICVGLVVVLLIGHSTASACDLVIAIALSRLTRCLPSLVIVQLLGSMVLRHFHR